MRWLVMAALAAMAWGAGAPASAAPEVIASGLVFPEGPTLSPDGNALYVVNVQRSFVSRIALDKHALTREWVTLPAGGRGNGSTLGPDGALYVADVGAKRIDRISLPGGKVTVVADKNDTGGPLLGPNDLVFDKRGGLYFTDPDGSWDKPIGAVYYVAPKTHQVSKVAGGLQFPNGLALSADQKTLYVGESPLNQIDAIDLTPNGIVPPGRKRVFARVHGPDGMRMGRDEFLYAALFGEGVIAKISPSGEVVHRYPIGVGKNVTNLCFARDGKSLYVTETESNKVIRLPL